MFKGIGGVFGALALVVSFSFVSSAQALQFNQDVTTNVIFGSGNANGSFTTDRQNGVELGLRAKLRFNSSNLPENTFNSNGTGGYNFDTGTPTLGSGFGFANDADTPIWNFEWSINTNFDGSNPGRNLDNLTYLLELDGNPDAVGTSFPVFFDPINQTFPDHAIGTNATGNGAGTEATSAVDYTALIANNNLAQNSWNYIFFGAFIDPNAPGTYTINLSAFDGNSLLAATSIDVNVGVVPLPAALPLYGTGLALMGFVGWRRRKAATA